METDNKLIAEFMNLQNTGMSIYKPKEYQYHILWGWLMPVVIKIESLRLDGNRKRVSVNIEQNYCRIQTNAVTVNDKYYYVRVEHEGTKLEVTYKAVVRFIQWYNHLKTNKYGK